MEPNEAGLDQVENRLDAQLANRNNAIDSVIASHAGRPVTEVEAALTAALADADAETTARGLRGEAERISKLPAAHLEPS